MELKYPILLIILPLLVGLYVFLYKKKQVEKKTGSKIANTFFIKNTEYYKKTLRSYKFYKYKK